MTEPRKLAEKLGVEYEPPHERYLPEYRREGDVHVVDFHQTNVQTEFQVSRLDIGKEIHAWVMAKCRLPASPPLLINERCNLSGPRGRTDMRRRLAERSQSDADWGEVVEQLCGKIIEIIREGEPVVRLAEVPPRIGPIYRAAPLTLDGMPSMVFGEGGTGKSLLSDFLGICVQSGVEHAGITVDHPGPVLVCDWETDATTHREQALRIARGLGIEDEPEMWSLHYRACYAPLHEEADAIARYIDREGIVMVILDSLGAACGGDKNSQEVAQRVYSAIRSWRRAVWCIDHVAKGGDTPFGSVYFVNNTRSVWRVRSEMRDGSNVLTQGLYQTKRNFGPQKPIGFQYTFGPDAEACDTIAVESYDPAKIAPVEGDRGDRETIRQTLRNARESLTIGDIADMTGIKEKNVRNRVSEMVKGQEAVCIPIRGAANRYALRSAREDEA